MIWQILEGLELIVINQWQCVVNLQQCVFAFAIRQFLLIKQKQIDFNI